MNALALKITNYQATELIHESDRTLVYRGCKTDEGQSVVIKVMRNEYPSFNELVKFRNQYTIAKNLDIEGVVQTYALERYGNSYALIMEDIGGISLAEYPRKSSLSLLQFFDIAIQLANILHLLHQNNIIHKDIKPANILIHPDTQQVKLIDFSISTLLPKETQTIQTPNFLEGTLAYLSPEQTGRMNRGIDYRSDFYSLGVTFYELLTGTVPFSQNDPLELIHAHIAQHPNPMSQESSLAEKSYPQPLSDIVTKLMAKNAEDRYQSALGLKYDLEKCQKQYRESGKIEPFVLGERDICDRFLIPEKLYGRETEVQTLLDAFERVAAGNSEMMLVAGFSGIGKTAVINEVHKPIVRQRGYFIKGKFDQFNRNIPFSAFVQAFRDLMGQLLGESDTQLQQWKAKILKALGDSGQIIIDAIPSLEGIIGKQPAVPELSGGAAQNRFNSLFGKFVRVFTTKEHPLVLFLDDLQWADSASLNLLKLLMGDAETGHLLVLGAYRDNEVFPAHPLMLALNEITKNQAILNTITLEPLSESGLNLLIADTLSCTLELAFPLTELIYQKTKGNPFFATQFLKALNEGEWISYNRELGYWQCDIVAVQQLALTEDVVEFMAAQLQKLPSETQEVLKLAACIGNQFDLATLAIVSEQSLEEVATALWKALQEGLVLPQSEIYKFFQGRESETRESSMDISAGYQFLHDRVQQAAYLLIADNRKQPVHLKIGQLLLAHKSHAEQEDSDNIFNILNHLMMGIDADPSSIPVKQLAELALSAGMKAKLSIAYQAAIEYFNFGLSRLSQDSWNTHYRLMLDLNREKGECHYLVGQFAESESILNDALAQVQKPLDAAQIYDILMTQRMTQGTDILSSVDAGIKGLAILGMKIPTEGLALESLVEAELQQVQNAFEQMSPQVLLELSPMSDPVQQRCMKLLGTLWSASYIAGNHRLNWLTTLRMMNISNQHGRADNSSFSYCAYGMVLASQERYPEAYQFGQVALEVDRIFYNPKFIAKNNNHFANAINPYTRHLKENLPLYQESVEICSEVGDVLFGVWAAALLIWTHLLKGTALANVEEQSEKYLSYVQGANDKNMLYLFQLEQQFVREVMDETNEDGTLTYQGFLNNPLLKIWQQSHFDPGINWYSFLVLQRLYLKENYVEALQVSSLLESPSGFFPVIVYHIYYTLSLTAVYPEVDRETQEVYWQKIQEKKQLFKTWSQNCPENFQHKYQLISAEMARLKGDRLQAIELYDKAIAGAKENKYLQEEALANELAAKFYLDWGKEKIARTYMVEAYYCYARWGAKAKTDRLEATYPQLLTPILQHPQSSLTLNATTTLTSHQTVCTATSTSAAISLLDLSAAIKAAQALSGEIELEALLAQLMQIVLENAGADKGALVLNNGGTWAVVAQCAQEVCELSLTPLNNADTLPASIVRSVQRTQQTVILNQVEKDTCFASDSYLSQQQPKSLFCTPILSQGQLIGILYLENNLSVDAFTQDRVEILNMLCSQAAISLENARLYQQAQIYAEQLEQSLKGLQQAQLQLVQSEKMSALGNLVAGVAHEINNPVGFIAGNLQPAQDYVQDLLNLIDLYGEKYPNPDEEIETEIEEMDLEFVRKDLPKLIGSMAEGTDRIRHISTSLRTFSRTDKEHKVPFDLHQGIDSTLLILKHRLKANEERPEIEIVKDYGDLSSVQCFPGQLNQVFMNLIANAIDALEERNIGKTYDAIKNAPNRITIATKLERDKNKVIICITDNGKGMSKEIKAKIFEQGFTTKDVGKGTGLGMAIARQIVAEKHGGNLSCHSELSKGTEFIISLPIE